MVLKPVPGENAGFFERAKYKVWKKFQNGKAWVKDHKTEIMIFGPVVIGTGTAIFKFVGKQITLHKETNLKDLWIYDRSLGRYWKLRRPLDTDEALLIEARREAGEKLGAILDEMKLLK